MDINNVTASVTWDEGGMPHSVMFDDKYFCKDCGYEEALYVACEGNYLRSRFTALDPSLKGVFTIIETGFGTGLDFCCAWQLWAQCAPASWLLHFISVELYPLSSLEISRALNLWPCLSPYKEELAAKYEPQPGGIADINFDSAGVRLTIVFDHVNNALDIIRREEIAVNGADAWFLDGFAPSKNPEMWSDKVFAAMALLSRAGTTLSTFTVAGFVRRGLSANGFSVSRILGHGKKKNVLTGFYSKEKE